MCCTVAVVRVERDGRRLRLEKLFAGVEAYVLDFARVERSGRLLGALLQLNEKQIGSGQACLLFQETRQYN